MSWFTTNIRDPIEAAIQPAQPVSANQPAATVAATNNGKTPAYAVPLLIVAVIVGLFYFSKRG